MGKFADQSESAVKLPEHRYADLKKIRACVSETDCPTAEAVSRNTGIEEETVRVLTPYLFQAVSLDAPVRTPDGDEGETFADLFLPVNVDFLEGLQKDELRKLLNQLPQRHCEILMLRYGAFGRKQKTLQEIADAYGITRERVRQIETRALEMCKTLGRDIA